jgi:uncharacterized protein YbaP (TraB family)
MSVFRMKYLVVALCVITVSSVNPFVIAESTSNKSDTRTWANLKCESEDELRLEYPEITHRPSASAVKYGRGILWKVITPDKSDLGANYVFAIAHAGADLSSYHGCAEKIISLPNFTSSYIAETNQSSKSNAVYLERSVLAKGTLEPLLGKIMFEKYVSVLNEQGWSPTQIEELKLHSVKPWRIGMHIIRAVETPLEMQLYQQAEKVNKAIVNVESMDELVDMLESFPYEDWAALAIESLEDLEKMQGMIEKTMKLYVQQDIGQIYQDTVSYKNSKHPEIEKRLNDKLLFERTDKMIKVAVREFKKGKVFMAVGAAHIAGERGLLQGLVNAGYQVSPIFELFSLKSRGRSRAEIEASE